MIDEYRQKLIWGWRRIKIGILEVARATGKAGVVEFDLRKN